MSLVSNVHIPYIIIPQQELHNLQLASLELNPRLTKITTTWCNGLSFLFRKQKIPICSSSTMGSEESITKIVVTRN